MNLIDRNTFSLQLLWNRLKIFFSYLTKCKQVPSIPIEIMVEVTNHCNIKCSMCSNSVITRKKGYMSWDTLKKLVDEIKNKAELVYLYGLGEPLLHPQIVEMIQYCKDNNLRVGLSTNVTLLSEKMSQKLLNSGLDYLIFSLGGLTKETHEKILVNARYDVVHKNIMDYLKLKAETKSKLYTIIQIVYLEENKHEIDQFVRYWKKFEQVNEIRIKPYVNFDYMRKDIKLNESRKKPRCFYIWRQAYIYWDGTMVMCCMDSDEEIPLGNIHEKSLYDIWNDKKIQGIRTLHVTGNAYKCGLCNTCNLSQFSVPVVFGISLFDSLTVKKVLPKVEKFYFKLFRKKMFDI